MCFCLCQVRPVGVLLAPGGHTLPLYAWRCLRSHPAYQGRLPLARPQERSDQHWVQTQNCPLYWWDITLIFYLFLFYHCFLMIALCIYRILFKCVLAWLPLLSVLIICVFLGGIKPATSWMSRLCLFSTIIRYL